jgi:hypothetical protein
MAKLIFCVAVLCLGAGCRGPESLSQEFETANPSPSPSQDLVMFVTSTDYSGNLGGISGADSVCNSRALAAGLSGAFVAWISDSSNQAIDRLTSNGPWKWRNGTTVFANKLGIPNSEVIAPFDEFGNFLSSDNSWTGSESDGTVNPDNCLNWTSSNSGIIGMEGDFGPGVGLWSKKGTGTCDNLRKLICFQI